MPIRRRITVGESRRRRSMSPTVRVDKGELDREFRKETQTRLAHDTKWGVLHTLYMYPVFIPLDFLVYPDQAMTFVWIRLAVVALSIGIHFVMRLPFAEQHAKTFASFVYLYCTISIVVMVHLADGYASPYYAGVNLVLIAFMFIAPMRLRETIVVCLIVYAVYIVPIVAQNDVTDYAVLAGNNFFLLSTMALVSVSSYIATAMRKKEFSSRYELARANDELTKLDVLKSQFFASISHEIRTPLTSIMAPTDSLKRGDVGTLTDAQRELVAQVNRNALRLLDLINQMLDFAKFDAKKMTLHLRRVSMTRVIRNQIALFREVCRRKGLEMQSDIDEEIPTVFLDADKVDRILSNLIRNAIKFTDQGSITVRARLEREAADPSVISRGRAAPGSWITFAVQDTGIGIAPEDTARVFQRFQQVDGSSTRRYEGTGLGLAIVQESVELQHGEISVSSAKGIGTTFTVRLPVNLDELEPTAFIDRRQLDRRQDSAEFTGPDRRVGPRRTQDFGRLTLDDIAMIELENVARAADAGQDHKSNDDAEDSGISVLYVEDNTDLRSYIARMLRSFGHTVRTATDGAVGWRAAQEQQFDIVVSDVMMPGIDGFELARLVKSNAMTRKIPVILITAKSDTEARIEGLELGADDYIAKPVNVRELDARIRNIVADRNFREALTRAEELETRVHELALGFSESLELRDGYTAGHSNDVLNYGTMIAEGLGIPMTETIRESLLLHDIGKIGIPDALLHKPAPLTEDEWTIMRRHPEMGADLLSRFDSLAPVAEVVHAHHERFDGSGYPRGLRGEEIPLEARLIAVADAWHAMMEDRTYRKALEVNDAVSELVRNRGRQFDPRAVDALLNGLIESGRIDEELVSTQLASARAF
jgi:response regulator RpfG family c-di-GMP phosphodiesterase/signal transduction histidine kinase